jgi:hypothetical protein
MLMRNKYAKPVRFLAGMVVILVCSAPRLALATTVAPTPPAVSYTNSVNFNSFSNVYDFYYSGADGTVKYEYLPSGTFNTLTCTVAGTNTFLPSNFGGLYLWTGTTSLAPWQGGTYSLLNLQTNSNILTTQFKWTYGSTNLTYTFQFQISARTLIIKATVQSGVSGRIILDRCENATNPATIHVPYLPSMNVLYAGGAFASMYFDWETTSASTIGPLDSVYSSSSVFYAQQANYNPRTDGTYNPLNETIYLTASPTLTDVLPSVINPISSYKNVSANYLVFDNWETPFSTINSEVQALQSAGVSNLWVIVHDWQNGGYDNQYPNVLPANSLWGGDAWLMRLSGNIRTKGYLFGLHENYVDFYPNAAAWNPSDVALNSDGSLKKSYLNPATSIQSYEMKPTRAASYLTNFASQIHNDYTTTASFLDVSPGINPSDKVDYDGTVTNAGMFREVMNDYRAFGGLLRNIHQGPVSGEGYMDLYYRGYFDDHSAQINSGGAAASSQYQHLPLLVDFDLLKMHTLEAVHGVGYYERFFTTNGINQFTSFPQSAVLEYMATELAYGHCGFVPTPSRVYNYVAAAQLEQKHLFPVQKLYANATPVSILYHDSNSNDEVSASDYIRRYPTTFDNEASVNYMSQVRVTYNNGLIVCINRHPTQTWQVQLGQSGGYFNYNAVINGQNSQWVGQNNATSYLLPPTNGWVVFTTNIIYPPQNINQLTDDGVGASSFTGATNWSNGLIPSSGNNYSTSFNLQTPNDTNAYTFGGNSLTVNAGGTLAFKCTNVITVNNLTLNGGSTSQAGTGQTPDYARLAGTINLAANTTFNGGVAARTLEVDAAISGSGGLTTTIGGSTTILNGNNTYTGTTIVQNNLTVGGSINSSTNLQINGGNLTTTGANQLCDSAAVTIATGSLTVGGNDTVGSLTAYSCSVNGPGTLTATTYNIANMSVNCNLGAGTLNITSNSFGTTVNLNGTAAATTVNITNSTLALGGSNRLAVGATVNLAGSGILAMGANNTVQALQFDGTLQVVGTWGSPSSSAANKSSRFTGTGILTVTSSLAPPNFLSGGVTIMPDVHISLTAAGVAGTPYRLWASTNIALTPVTNTWTLLESGTISTSPFTLYDLNATNFPQRFYLFSSP